MKWLTDLSEWLWPYIQSATLVIVAEWPTIITAVTIFVVSAIILLPVESAYRKYAEPWLYRRLEK